MNDVEQTTAIMTAIYFSMLMNAAGNNTRAKWNTSITGQQPAAYDLLQVAQSMVAYQLDNVFSQGQI